MKWLGSRYCMHWAGNIMSLCSHPGFWFDFWDKPWMIGQKQTLASAHGSAHDPGFKHSINTMDYLLTRAAWAEKEEIGNFWAACTVSTRCSFTLNHSLFWLWFNVMCEPGHCIFLFFSLRMLPDLLPRVLRRARKRKHCKALCRWEVLYKCDKTAAEVYCSHGIRVYIDDLHISASSSILWFFISHHPRENTRSEKTLLEKIFPKENETYLLIKRIRKHFSNLCR